MILLEVSLLVSIPGVNAAMAVAGGVLVLGSAIVSVLWDDNFPENFKDLFRSAAEEWWLGMEKAFENGPTFKAVAAVNGTLASQAAAFRTAITNTSFLLIDSSQSTALSALVDTIGVKALMAGAP
jgi:hypothetical protein